MKVEIDFRKMLQQKWPKTLVLILQRHVWTMQG